MSESKTSSVFTKGRVRDILKGIYEASKPLKSPKAILEQLEAAITEYTPQGRGRRPGSTAIDTTKLQQYVDDAAKSIVGNDPNYLAQFAASKWNVGEENLTRLMDGQTIKRLVLSGKVTMPTGFVYTVKPRKPKISATPTVAVESV